MHSKKKHRLKRSARAKYKIQELGIASLSVYKSSRYIYAQISVSAPEGRKVVMQVSSISKDFDKKHSNNIASAVQVGQLIAQKALAAGISQVAFNRSGYKYHGRVKALADAARDIGLRF